YAEGDVEVDGDELLDPGPEHLDGDPLAPEGGSVHLTEARGGDRLALELIEDLGKRLAERGSDHHLDRGGRLRGHPVLEASDLREVGLGEDIGARAEDLRELDEGRAEGGDRGRQSLRPPPMILGGAPGASTEDYPAPAVPHEGDEE